MRKIKVLVTWAVFLLFLVCARSYAETQVASDVQVLLSNQGKVLFGSEPNSIMVIDYPENIQRVQEYLEMVDVPAQQVLIEARVVEVKLQGEHALGINWSAFAEKGGFEMGQFRVGSTAGGALEQTIPYKPTYYPPAQTVTGEESPFTVTIFDENINIVLKALANSLNTNILSAPRVTTVNNREAEIKVVQKLPWAEPEVEMSDAGIAITWSVNFEEVGIVLKAMPTISEDGKITMVLEPEVSEKVGDYELKVIQGEIEVPYTVPIIDKRSAQTKVIIGDGQTLIIGGLIKEKITKGVTKVPLLGDIPGLGWFFKSKRDIKDKTELLIFVSPTIITPQVLTRMATEEKMGIGKWYMQEREKKEKELSEYLPEEKKTRDSALREALSQAEVGQDLNSKLRTLEERQEEIIQQRKEIEEGIK
ncbi:MAG: hypothetical protein ABIH40_05810 [Candidatus Omnitrophota bacterium]